MRRRNFITGTMAAAAAMAALPVSISATVNTFSDDDTLVQRIAKLNALMGTNYEVDVTYPKEWEAWWAPVACKDELLSAQFPRLIWDMRNPFEWSVHLRQNGKQCSPHMSPLQFFHWTSQMAWECRVSRAGKQR